MPFEGRAAVSCTPGMHQLCPSPALPHLSISGRVPGLNSSVCRMGDAQSGPVWHRLLPNHLCVTKGIKQGHAGYDPIQWSALMRSSRSGRGLGTASAGAALRAS